MKKRWQQLSGAHAAWLVAVAIICTTWLVYFPGLNGPFVFDDRANLIEQPQIHVSELNFESLSRAAQSSGSGPLGRPIAMASFAVNYYFAGLNAFAYKATNLAIHLISGLLIYLLTVRLLGHVPHLQDVTRTFLTQDRRRWIGLAVAAIWLCHPLNLTSVLYIVQRMNSLATLFMLTGLLTYAIGREQIREGRRLGLLTVFGAVPGFTLLAMHSKENGALLPVLVILVEVFFFRFVAAPGTSRPFKWLWWIVFAGPVLAGLIMIGLKPRVFLNLDGYSFRDFTLGDRLLTEGRVLWFYLRLIVLPDIRDMGLYHDDIATSRGLLDPISTLPALLGIAGLIAGTILLRRRQPLLAFGILWFFAAHSLESTFIPLELAHDHRNYLPMWGILLIVVWYLARPYPKLSDHPALRYSVIALVFVMMSFATYARANFWKSEWSLVNHDVLNHPQSARAHVSLGIAQYERGLHEQAQQSFITAANLDASNTTTIIRVVQHHYLWKKNIPESLLTEMEHRLMSHALHPVTLWTYEPLIRVTRPNRALQLRILEIYERVVSKSEKLLPPEWYAKAEYIIAFEAFHRGDTRKAIERINRAISLNPHDPGFFLLESEIYMKLNNQRKVTESMARLDQLDARLYPLDTDRATAIRRWLQTRVR